MEASSRHGGVAASSLLHMHQHPPSLPLLIHSLTPPCPPPPLHSLTYSLGWDSSPAILHVDNPPTHSLRCMTFNSASGYSAITIGNAAEITSPLQHHLHHHCKCLNCGSKQQAWWGCCTFTPAYASAPSFLHPSKPPPSLCSFTPSLPPCPSPPLHMCLCCQ